MLKPNSNTLLNIDLLLEKIEVQESSKIADFGCGSSGFFVFLVAQSVGKYGQIFAVDILKSNLENVKKKAELENFKNIKTVWSDLEIFGATQIEPGSLDIVLLINTLHQSDFPEKIVKEAVRVLKKNGRIVVVDWRLTASPMGPKLEKRIKAEKIKNIGSELNLDFLEEFKVGLYHYGLVFKKI